MTTIQTFPFANGRIIIADKANTLNLSIAKIDKLNTINGKIIFCGAGLTRIIMDIGFRMTTIEYRNLDELAQHIIDIKKSKIEEYRRYGTVQDTSEIEETDFLLIDKNSLEGIKTLCFEKVPLTKIDAIGSGSESLGLIQDELTKLEKVEVRDNFMHILKHVSVKSFERVARSDPVTGHPAVFGFDMWVITNNQIKKYRVSFKHEISNPENYELIEAE